MIPCSDLGVTRKEIKMKAINQVQCLSSLQSILRKWFRTFKIQSMASYKMGDNIKYTVE